MELTLYFQNGQMRGDGQDHVGQFVIKGTYDSDSGKCDWFKRYLGRHDVYYKGFNEGKGIWGTWEIPPGNDPNFERGGFHIWPKSMRDPTEPFDEASVDFENEIPTQEWSLDREEQESETLVPALPGIPRAE